MPRHKIEMWQPSKAVINADHFFDIFSDGEKLGTLAISKGTVDWWPKNRRSSTKITWERFAAAMDYLAAGNKLP